MSKWWDELFWHDEAGCAFLLLIFAVILILLDIIFGLGLGGLK